MREISIKAVLVGLVADVGGTAAFFFVFSLLGGILLSSMGRDIEELDVYTKTTGFLVLSSIGGTLFSAFGGYVSARIAGRAEIKNASATGVLSAATGLLFLVLSPDSSPVWLDVLVLIAIVPCAMLGGHVCLKGKREKSANKVKK
jgi:peptidoglycan/LPS O-acetylase OafA/YrhL